MIDVEIIEPFQPNCVSLFAPFLDLTRVNAIFQTGKVVVGTAKISTGCPEKHCCHVLGISVLLKL